VEKMNGAPVQTMAAYLFFTGTLNGLDDASKKEFPAQGWNNGNQEEFCQ
jgi:hypothetical protein